MTDRAGEAEGAAAALSVGTADASAREAPGLETVAEDRPRRLSNAGCVREAPAALSVACRETRDDEAPGCGFTEVFEAVFVATLAAVVTTFGNWLVAPLAFEAIAAVSCVVLGTSLALEPFGDARRTGVALARAWCGDLLGRGFTGSRGCFGGRGILPTHGDAGRRRGAGRGCLRRRLRNGDVLGRRGDAGAEPVCRGRGRRLRGRVRRGRAVLASVRRCGPRVDRCGPCSLRRGNSRRLSGGDGGFRGSFRR